MATSTCPKCDHEFFEMEEAEPLGRGTKFRLHLVQCARCGAVVGVIDYVDLATTVQKINERLEDMEHKLDYLIS